MVTLDLNVIIVSLFCAGGLFAYLREVWRLRRLLARGKVASARIRDKKLDDAGSESVVHYLLTYEFLDGDGNTRIHTRDLKIRNFFSTIDRGYGRIEAMFAEMQREEKVTVDPAKAADLYQTYGVPPELLETLAAENNLAFPNNDLPGVYGAGAVQTLMNVHGIRPGSRVLMVGSGNIGIIVSYQMLQAGIDVVAVVEALPRTASNKILRRQLRARYGD